MVQERATHHAQRTGISSQRTSMRYLERKRKMSLAKHHNLRTMMGLTWRGEYVLAVLAEENECGVSTIRGWGVLEKEIGNVVEILREKGLVQTRSINKKIKLHSLTDLGKEYIEQVQRIYDHTREKSQRQSKEDTNC